MDNNHDNDPVMKLAKKLGVHEEFMQYCEDKGEEVTQENSADLLKAFLKEQGYTQSELKEMLAERSDVEDMDEEDEMEDEEEDEEPKKGGVTIAIVMGKGKGGKMPPAWS